MKEHTENPLKTILSWIYFVSINDPPYNVNLPDGPRLFTAHALSGVLLTVLQYNASMHYG